MSARGFGGWCARVVCLGLVGSFASESLAQSTASFPPSPGSPNVPVPVPAPSSASTPSASPSANPPRTTDTRTDLENRAAADATSAPQPAPRSFGSGVYPALLPYREGLPIPLGYHVEHRSANGLIGAGLASLIISYTAAIVLGASANFKDGTGWLVLPVVGPWAAIGARSYHCDNNPLHANQCVSGAFSEVQTIAILSGDAVIQATGTVLFIAGLASGSDELVRSDLRASVRISPRSVGATGFGIGVDGLF